MKNPFKVKGNFKISTFLIQVFMPLIGGALVGYLNRNTMGQYIELTKPFFAPPGMVFPIVWAILYLLMGVSAYRIYMLGMSGEDVSSAMFFYYIQLIFNYLWVFIFFSFRLYGLAFIELAILFILVLITFIKFFRKDKLAGILLIPYLVWLIFAGVLNFYIWLLNEA